ncbi:hypothetical protein [Streptomyces ortus]|uniref:Uncharacterized protein n=1 Tax=Streptomyces ortus TaxID=2867268 RepID=A0ABT3UVZ0_9ACTN|nr:hypothetical protein [Streptomyces ortus]MCX4231742.1 hypothetical protein [Streptomyces ortus]
MTTHGAGATSTPALLRIAEDELQKLRGQLATAAGFIHDPAHDLSARQALAQLLKLPHPVLSGRAGPQEPHPTPDPAPSATDPYSRHRGRTAACPPSTTSSDPSAPPASSTPSYAS